MLISKGVFMLIVNGFYRPEELRAPFERFGVVRDVYIPKDYYTGCVSLHIALTEKIKNTFEFCGLIVFVSTIFLGCATDTEL